MKFFKHPLSLCISSFIGTAVIGMFVLATPSSAKEGEAQLLYYFSHICEYCEQWDLDVGAYYNKTEEAKTLPLRRVDADEKRPQDIAHIDNVVFTPTFVVVQGGREVGRIVGYVDEGFFWGYLKPLVEKTRLRQASQQSQQANGLSGINISGNNLECGVC